MGLFRKGKTIKQGKIYSMTDALQILSQPGYENYTTEEVSGGYRIIGVNESKILERQIREKQQFHNRMNGNGSYRNNMVVPQQYNNWQAETNVEYTR